MPNKFIIKDGSSCIEWIKQYMAIKSNLTKKYFGIYLYKIQDFKDIDYVGRYYDEDPYIFDKVKYIKEVINQNHVEDNEICPQCIIHKDDCYYCNYASNYGPCFGGNEKNPYTQISNISAGYSTSLVHNKKFLQELKKFVNNTIEIKEI